jgi:biopolymer transport protein ExbD
MRRFSQRSHLVTLSDINITPLLDLAFVLLIIFIITTPLLEKGMELKLPTASGQKDEPINVRDIRTVEISTQGIYTLNRQRMTLAQVESQLVRDFKANPAIVIYVRADEGSRMKDYVALTEVCTRNGISRFSIRTTDPSTTR